MNSTADSARGEAAGSGSSAPSSPDSPWTDTGTHGSGAAAGRRLPPPVVRTAQERQHAQRVPRGARQAGVARHRGHRRAHRAAVMPARGGSRARRRARDRRRGSRADAAGVPAMPRRTGWERGRHGPSMPHAAATPYPWPAHTGRCPRDLRDPAFPRGLGSTTPLRCAPATARRHRQVHRSSDTQESAGGRSRSGGGPECTFAPAWCPRSSGSCSS